MSRKPWDQLSEGYRRELTRRLGDDAQTLYEAGEHTTDRPPRSAQRGTDSRREPLTAPAAHGRNGDDPLRDKLEEAVVKLGFVIHLVEPFDGAVILARSGELADTTIAIAADNPRVRATLERLVAGGSWLALAGVVASITVPIAMHHGLLPAHEAMERLFIPEAALPHYRPPAPADIEDVEDEDEEGVPAGKVAG